MPPSVQRRRSALDFRCGSCDRSYAKKEHLQPFACDVCGRTFARQDALNRHTRVHKGSTSTTTHMAEQVRDGGFDPRTFVPEQYNQHVDQPLVSPLAIEGDFQHSQSQNSFLFWPDSEHLLQNILSIDPTLLDQPPAYMPPPPGSQPSPGWDYIYDNATEGLDEGHRAIHTLSTLLSNTVNRVTAPAALANLTSRFLDSCLHMFFSTFIPMMPIIHRPTFVFQNCSPPLLLNAIAIGSLFLGNEEASDKGDALWRLAHTAVQTSWHTMIKHRGEFDASPGIQLVQTALLSQIYAALSKSRNLRITSQVFHGLGFYWARYCGLFDLPDVPIVPQLHDDPETKYRAWRLWLARETQLRSLLGLYIIDGVISQYSGSPTVAQHMSNQLLVPSSEACFRTDSPDDWIRAVTCNNSSSNLLRFCDLFRHFFYDGDQENGQIPPEMSSFTLKVILEGLKSLVAESKRIEPRPVGVPSRVEISGVLDRVRRYIEAHSSLTPVARSTAMLRWHAICLDALGSVTARGARRLCTAHGISQHIFGGGKRVEKDVQAERYVNSEDARRTLMHASEIHRIASQLPLGLAHDPHVPGAVFAAATTYAAFALAGKTQVAFPEPVDWQQAVLLPSQESQTPAGFVSNDLHTTGTAQFIRGTLTTTRIQKDFVFRDLNYELSSIRLLLRALSLQWGVCKEMEEVVDAWIAKCT
ncbi:C2H2 type zinc finger domain protein [Paraphaeosphaeria sporulosa]